MRQTSSTRVAAIDVHGHYGKYCDNKSALADEFMSADAATVAERARKVNIELTVVSPLLGLMPRFCADAAVGNDEAVKVVAETPRLLQWVIINPLQPKTYEQAAVMLGNPWCVGVKIHPEEHGYPIQRFGNEIFEFCAARRAVILTHSGETSSMPEISFPSRMSIRRYR